MDRVKRAAVRIQEAGLLIRPWRGEDAEAVYQACQDPQIQRWTAVPRPYHHEHAHGFVTGVTQRAWADQTAAPLGVFDAATGRMLGSNGLITLQLDQATGEIGYWTAPWARGQAVATNATRAVSRWCLDTLGLQRVAWRAEIGNHASRLVAERVGFRLEGVLRNGARRADGTRVNCWSAALLPGQLIEASAPIDPIATRRAATFGRPHARLTAKTRRGATIALRTPEERDIDAIVAACRDPEAIRWTGVPDPYEIGDARFFVHEYAPDCWACGTGAVFAVADEDDACSGSMERRIGARDTGDVGFLIAPWARHLGYGSAALRAVCSWGFEALGLRRIEWRAFVGNDASRGTAERAGFAVEGIARAAMPHRGEYRDTWIGSRLATDA